ncbi:Maf family protein [Flaviflagellibacter deserti]|uniref:Nucleoside triphosphate pyrophosphatase n=1 Tax=Flaviflagellibacter deserti TaxID=2267266 RepID=A0ABV9Z3Q1_9HYPH
MSDLAHPLWIEPWPLVLASGSASRAEMLRNAGIPIEVSPADLDERTIEAPLIEAKASPGDVALALAMAKAEAISLRFPNRLVLGADQVLAAGHEYFVKPSGLAAARTQLLRLRDREHGLFSAGALAVNGRTEETVVSEARLTMRPFSEEFLDRYLAVAGNKVTTTVGGYMLEQEGIHLFDSIKGDFHVILGLPLLPLLAVLRRRGLLLE